MSLKDELLKANLISKKQLKRIAHEQRMEKQRLGKKGIEEKKEKEKNEIKAKQEAQKKQDQEQAKKLNEERLEKERKAKIHNLITEGRIKTEGGPRRFYFVSLDGKIPFLSLADSLAKKLERGQAGIVELGEWPRSHFIIVKREAAEKLKKLKTGKICFFNEK